MTPERRRELLAASRLGRLVAFGTELPPDALFGEWNPKKHPRKQGRFAPAESPASDGESVWSKAEKVLREAAEKITRE